MFISFIEDGAWRIDEGQGLLLVEAHKHTYTHNRERLSGGLTSTLPGPLTGQKMKRTKIFPESIHQRILWFSDFCIVISCPDLKFWLNEVHAYNNIQMQILLRYITR